MKYLKLRIAWSVAWGVVAVLLVALWVRSYSDHHLDILPQRPTGPPFALVNSTYLLRGSICSYTFVHESHWLYNWLPSARLQGAGFLLAWTNAPPWYFAGVPLWFPVAIAIGLGGIPWLRWRFTLRTLLIVTTLVALSLGLVVWLR